MALLLNCYKSYYFALKRYMCVLIFLYCIIVLTDNEKSKKEKGKVCISTWYLTMWMQYYHYYYYYYNYYY